MAASCFFAFVQTPKRQNNKGKNHKNHYERREIHARTALAMR